MKTTLLLIALCLMTLTACSGGYQVNSYALSRSDEPVKSHPVVERVPYR